MPSPLVTVMSNAALKAGKTLLRDFGEVDQLQVSRKGPANFVTKTDLKVEKQLQVELSRARAEFGFLMEESGEVAGTDRFHRWIIDPLDGTVNFIHAVPYFCISIGLERTLGPGKSEIIAGVVYDPIHNDLFTVEKGGGAQLNGRRLQVAQRENMEEAMVVADYPRDRQRQIEMLKNVSAAQITVRYPGACALDLAYVAAGRYDACWFDGAKPWDVAAGLLLVQEAGGVYTQIDGKPATAYSPSTLAASPSMHGRMLKLLAGPAGGG